jgi:hypothetical protein
MRERLHYVCRFRLLGREGFFLWHTSPEADDPDGVLLEGPGRLLVRDSEEALRLAAAALALDTDPGPPVPYELERLAAWCRAPRPEALDARQALDAWNLFGDLPRPEGALWAQADRAAAEVYHRLFFTQGLPALAAADAEPPAPWSAEELRQLRRVLELGLALFTALLPG